MKAFIPLVVWILAIFLISGCTHLPEPVWGTECPDISNLELEDRYNTYGQLTGMKYVNFPPDSDWNGWKPIYKDYSSSDCNEDPENTNLISCPITVMKLFIDDEGKPINVTKQARVIYLKENLNYYKTECSKPLQPPYVMPL
jgi:hypothetical protein